MLNTKLIRLFKCLWENLSARRKLQFIVLLGLMLISAFAEVVSLGAVIPFLAVLIEPEKVLEYPIVASSAHAMGVTEAEQLVVPITIIFSLAALIAGSIRILMLYVSTRIAYASASDLAIDVYQKSLYQPYRVHISRNSSQIISAVTTKVNDVAFSVLLSFPTLVSSLVLFGAILSTLIVINPDVALLATAVFGLSYCLIALLSRRRLRAYSQCVALEQTQIVKILQEGIGSIRDILLDGTQSVFSDIYRKSDISLRKAQGNTLFINISPRYAMEALGIVLIALLSCYLSYKSGGVSEALPVLGALALGAQRLLPALQQIYSSVTSIQAGYASLVDVIDLLNQPLPSQSLEFEPISLKFEKSIKLQNVGFRYEHEGPIVLDDLNLIINKGDRVGVIGTTGSGKSTLLDILMGLLEPTSGQVCIDDITLTHSNRQSWRQMIAHVPQYIYLTDTTIAENIAFGIPVEKIDMDRVKLAARQAQISSFIESMSDGYLSLLGERGVSFSGGQRQRIGIARALYKHASILVFDEATSALDSDTELAVMQTIDGLGEHYTVLIVAHRLSTLKKCTQIVELSKGVIKKIGNYQDVINRRY